MNKYEESKILTFQIAKSSSRELEVMESRSREDEMVKSSPYEFKALLWNRAAVRLKCRIYILPQLHELKIKRVSLLNSPLADAAISRFLLHKFAILLYPGNG